MLTNINNWKGWEESEIGRWSMWASYNTEVHWSLLFQFQLQCLYYLSAVTTKRVIMQSKKPATPKYKFQALYTAWLVAKSSEAEQSAEK